MTPATIRKATSVLATGLASYHDARTQGAALGRTLAAEVRGREIAARRINVAAAIAMELELLKLAAGADELIAEIADSALRELRHIQPCG